MLNDEDIKKLSSILATKEDLESLETSVANGFLSIDKRFNNAEADVKSFKTETREHLDKIEEKLGEVNENVEAIIKDYHPRIEALEAKVL